MRKVIHRILSKNILRLSLIILFAFSTALSAQGGDPVVGKSLFNANCAACHQLDKKMTGPALRNLEKRLGDEQGLDKAWIYAWIRNSAGIIKSGDAYANKVYNEYGGAAMTAFPQLSDGDIDNILAYTAEVKAEAPAAAGTSATASGAAQEGGISNQIILGALAILFILLAAGLYVVNKTSRRFAAAQNIELPEESKRTPLWQAFVKNQFLMLVVSIFFLLASAYFVYGYFMQIGVDQGYQPVQPIHYSHRIHAGDNAIDCKYCHSSARTSKHSGIPSINVCMNCHKSIYQVAPETQAEGAAIGVDYNAEIKKLYKAAGWDDAEQKYTGNSQPIKWVRIHNLPDFVYFNHSQHVTVAGVECQTCHGPIQEMEVVSQFAPLTMGWCIECHRTTDVNIKDNAYYAKIHEALAKKHGKDKFTVAEMGGLECGKCHY